jgi:hypothetical protein
LSFFHCDLNHIELNIPSQTQKNTATTKLATTVFCFHLFYNQFGAFVANFRALGYAFKNERVTADYRAFPDYGISAKHGRF